MDAAAVYAQQRDHVLRVLERRCGWLNATDREAVFHDAFAVLLEKERDGRLDPELMHSRQLRGYLVQTALNKALDEGKRAERRYGAPLGDTALEQPDATEAPEDVAAASIDAARVRELLTELPPRRQAVIKLRFLFERTPEEIQRFLDISPRIYRKEIERGLRQIAGDYELVQSGRWCESRQDLIRAYIAGVADPARARQAREHLANCPGCAHMAAEMRRAATRVGAAVPAVPGIPRDSALDRALELASSAREALGDGFATAKQQALSLVARGDPSAAQYAASARPGAIAAAIGGCVTLAGGAAYCVVDGVPEPLRSAIVHERAAEGSPGTATRESRKGRARVEAPPVVPARPDRPAQPQPQPRPPAPSAEPNPTEPEPVATEPVAPSAQEFDPAPSVEQAAPSTQSQPPPSPEPPGEFDP
jgi:RNA polymerase sigma factor (sigma-70 family)